MVVLEEMCRIVDSFLVDGTSPSYESSAEFWHEIDNDPTHAQMYTECLIYKYIALSSGFGDLPLFSALSQIKNISSDNQVRNISSAESSSIPTSSPRGSVSNSEKGKRGSGSLDVNSQDVKTTPKRKYNIGRRKSKESKKLSRKHNQELVVEATGRHRGSKGMRKSISSSDGIVDVNKSIERQLESNLENILLSLAYMSKMCDLTQWDFTKLREVFLTWNKARGWEQSASDYEYSVMKKFSLLQTNQQSDVDQNVRFIEDILTSVNAETGNSNIPVLNCRRVGESIKYWSIRRKILTSPQDAVSNLKSIILLAKKTLEEVDESKILPLLHILCETIIMCPHTPLELLQDCYSLFERFYVWPKFIAHPVKEVLDMIQQEMKCPGHFFRVMFLQDNDMLLSQHLGVRIPSSETHVLLDEDLPDAVELADAFITNPLNSASSFLSDKTEKMRYIISHIFESVFGSECCDLATLDEALRAVPVGIAPDLFGEALALMEKASLMRTHKEAQNFLRAELEVFAEKIVSYLEAEIENDSNELQVDNKRLRPPSGRRVSVLYDSCRTRESMSSPSHRQTLSSPLRNPSYLRRSSSGSLDNQKNVKRHSSQVAPKKRMPFELIGPKINFTTFDKKDLSDTMFELARNTAKSHMQEKRRSGRLSFSRKRNSSHLASPDTFRDSGVIDDDFSGSAKKQSNSVSTKNLVTALKGLQIKEVSEKEPDAENAQGSEATPTDSQTVRDRLSQLMENEDIEGFWKQFIENGFSSSDNISMEELLNSMSPKQKKSFLLEKPATVPDCDVKPANLSLVESLEGSTPNSVPPASPISITTETASQSDDIGLPPSPSTDVVKQKERKKSNRISQFRPKSKYLLRHKHKSSRKHKGDKSDKIFSTESLTSNSSSTSEEWAYQPIPRSRTTSDPLYKNRKGRLNGKDFTVSPLIAKFPDHDDSPKNPFNFSVRSLPSMYYSNDAYSRERLVSNVDSVDAGYGNLPSTRDSVILVSPPAAGSLLQDGEITRNRIDSGIGQENSKEIFKKALSLIGTSFEHEDSGIGGVRLARGGRVRATQRVRSSVSEAIERTQQKKILKLVFIGNDRTLGHMARAYYEMRKQQMSRAPIFQHVDLRLFFIPVAFNGLSPELRTDTVDVQNCGNLGMSDAWYHTTVMLSTNNLLRLYPRVRSQGCVVKNSPEKSSRNAKKKVLPPQKVFANILSSYSRFAVKITNVSMLKVVMTTNLDEVLTDVFCFKLDAGHNAYTRAVKAGFFGKMGKLVDLSDDNEPPAAYMKIRYSEWSLDGMLNYTGCLDETFFHTVRVSPMPFVKEQYRGQDTLHLFALDNEKRPKVFSQDHTIADWEAEGKVVNVGNMSMEVTRPRQGTFSLVLDDSKIYTNIKSLEVSPCTAPEMEGMRLGQSKMSRRVAKRSLMRLPIRTFWPVLD